MRKPTAQQAVSDGSGTAAAASSLLETLGAMWTLPELSAFVLALRRTNIFDSAVDSTDSDNNTSPQVDWMDVANHVPGRSAAQAAALYRTCRPVFASGQRVTAEKLHSFLSSLYPTTPSRKPIKKATLLPQSQSSEDESLMTHPSSEIHSTSSRKRSSASVAHSSDSDVAPTSAKKHRSSHAASQSSSHASSSSAPAATAGPTGTPHRHRRSRFGRDDVSSTPDVPCPLWQVPLVRAEMERVCLCAMDDMRKHKRKLWWPSVHAHSQSQAASLLHAAEAEGLSMAGPLHGTSSSSPSSSTSSIASGTSSANIATSLIRPVPRSSMAECSLMDLSDDQLLRTSGPLLPPPVPVDHSNSNSSTHSAASHDSSVNATAAGSASASAPASLQVVAVPNPSAFLNPLVRRFALCEFFASSVDEFYFADHEFARLCVDLGIPAGQKMTRVEWGFVRSHLGKPRRFSKAFVEEEISRLDKYRRVVRKLQDGKLPRGRDEHALLDYHAVPQSVPVGSQVHIAEFCSGLVLPATIVARVSAQVDKERAQERERERKEKKEEKEDGEEGSKGEKHILRPRSTGEYIVRLEADHNHQLIRVPDYAIQPTQELPLLQNAQPSKLKHGSHQHGILFSSNGSNLFQGAFGKGLPGSDGSDVWSNVPILPLSSAASGTTPVQCVDPRILVSVELLLERKAALVQKLAECNRYVEQCYAASYPLSDDFRQQFAMLILSLKRLNRTLVVAMQVLAARPGHSTSSQLLSSLQELYAHSTHDMISEEHVLIAPADVDTDEGTSTVVGTQSSSSQIIMDESSNSSTATGTSVSTTGTASSMGDVAYASDISVQFGAVNITLARVIASFLCSQISADDFHSIANAVLAQMHPQKWCDAAGMPLLSVAAHVEGVQLLEKLVNGLLDLEKEVCAAPTSAPATL